MCGYASSVLLLLLLLLLCAATAVCCCVYVCAACECTSAVWPVLELPGEFLV
jgi:hypothetical protein